MNGPEGLQRKVEHILQLILKSHVGVTKLIVVMLIGLPKAEYALGYFTEMGIGCRRDPLEANVWYVKAADQGDERARNRLATIRAAASGDVLPPPSHEKSKGRKGSGLIPSDSQKLEKDRDAKDCIVM